MVHLITLIGIIFTILFHVFVKEPKVPSLLEMQDIESIAATQIDGEAKQMITNKEDNILIGSQQNINNENKSELVLAAKLSPQTQKEEPTKRLKRSHDMRIWSDWLKSISFWKICFIYMMSRLYVNITQVYTPLYLQETLHLAKVHKSA